MKKRLILKYVLSFVICTLPFILRCAVYWKAEINGFYLVYLLFPVLLILTLMNFFLFRKNLHFIIAQIILLITMSSLTLLSTYLYYTNISNDSMTPVVGQAIAWLGAIFIVIATPVIIGIKYLVSYFKSHQN